jgi:hypothetical protein
VSPLQVGLVVVGASAALFVVSEVAARAWLKRFGRAYVWAPYSRVKMIIDREVLPTLEPAVEHYTNPDGERGDPVPRDHGTLFRVLVVGGSAAECWFLDQGSSWPNVVQMALREPRNLAKLGAKSVHVGNIGRSLVTTRHLDAILARVLPRYDKLDAIVFMVGVSDLVLWLESGAPKHLVEGPIPPFALTVPSAGSSRSWLCAGWLRSGIAGWGIRCTCAKASGNGWAMRVRCGSAPRR